MRPTPLLLFLVALWLALSSLGWRYPGDEYALFFIGDPLVWLAAIITDSPAAGFTIGIILICGIAYGVAVQRPRPLWLCMGLLAATTMSWLFLQALSLFALASPVPRVICLARLSLNVLLYLSLITMPLFAHRRAPHARNNRHGGS